MGNKNFNSEGIQFNIFDGANVDDKLKLTGLIINPKSEFCGSGSPKEIISRDILIIISNDEAEVMFKETFPR